jgi:hypothetical protein
MHKQDNLQISISKPKHKHTHTEDKKNRSLYYNPKILPPRKWKSSNSKQNPQEEN